MIYLTVDNNQKLFKNINTASDFYYQISDSLVIGEDWEIALASAGFNTKIKNNFFSVEVDFISDTSFIDNNKKKS